MRQPTQNESQRIRALFWRMMDQSRMPVNTKLTAILAQEIQCEKPSQEENGYDY